jgi:F0F1-type ATP synthase delta subunit
MQHVSRKKVAQAAVAMLDTHAPAEVVAALAQEVIERRWAADVDLLLKDMAVELLKQKRHAVVTLTSARALPEGLLTQIKQLLQERLQATTVTLDTIVDSTLAGGIVATTPKGVLDASVTGRLNQLNQL